jgi:hypothetical protein
MALWATADPPLQAAVAEIRPLTTGSNR